MKIALFNCHERSVPPKKGGAIEKIINYLIDGFILRNHKVTLFSTGDSLKRPGLELVSIYPSEIEAMEIPEMKKLELNKKWTEQLGSILISRQREFDIVNDFCVGVSLPSLSEEVNVSSVFTLENILSPEQIDRLTPYKKNNFISVSFDQRKPFPELNYLANIYNAIDVDASPKPSKREDYLIFVGRITYQKSPHLAIEVAKRLGKKLYILGLYKDKHIQSEYFENYFLPALKENSSLVEWIGEVDENTVQKYFNKAYASLHTATYQEPFGMTLIESMAAGCPVIAFNRGAIPEVIEDGKTGFIVGDVEEMVKKVKEIDKIDGNYCREYVKKRFDVDRMAEDYIKAYKKLLESN